MSRDATGVCDGRWLDRRSERQQRQLGIQRPVQQERPTAGANGVCLPWLVQRYAGGHGLAFGSKTYPIAATLQGNCTIQINRSSDGALLYSEGNATFQATAVDSGMNSGIGSDSFALVVYEKNGVVYKNVPTAPLQGGNVVVHQ